jgi:hypothetical protein
MLDHLAEGPRQDNYRMTQPFQKNDVAAEDAFSIFPSVTNGARHNSNSLPLLQPLGYDIIQQLFAHSGLVVVNL